MQLTLYSARWGSHSTLPLKSSYACKAPDYATLSRLNVDDAASIAEKDVALEQASRL